MNQDLLHKYFKGETSVDEEKRILNWVDESEENRKLLMETLRSAVRKDPVKTTVVDMTKLGLIEITRKKVRPSLYQQAR